jgi:hypothetical protein
MPDYTVIREKATPFADYFYNDLVTNSGLVTGE